MNIYTGYETTAKKIQSGLWSYRGYTIERVGTITSPPYFWKVRETEHEFEQLGYARKCIDLWAMNELEERHTKLQPYCGCRVCEETLKYEGGVE